MSKAVTCGTIEYTELFREILAFLKNRGIEISTGIKKDGSFSRPNETTLWLIYIDMLSLKERIPGATVERATTIMNSFKALQHTAKEG